VKETASVLMTARAGLTLQILRQENAAATSTTESNDTAYDDLGSFYNHTTTMYIK